LSFVCVFKRLHSPPVAGPEFSAWPLGFQKYRGLPRHRLNSQTKDASCSRIVSGRSTCPASPQDYIVMVMDGVSSQNLCTLAYASEAPGKVSDKKRMQVEEDLAFEACASDCTLGSMEVDSAESGTLVIMMLPLAVPESRRLSPPYPLPASEGHVIRLTSISRSVATSNKRSSLRPRTGCSAPGP
jgi:hypothetical protein